MYYEVHGEGPPLVLLHGAYMTADMMGPLAAGLAETRQVIVPEMQAHGRTADVDRPLSYEQMADDDGGADRATSSSSRPTSSATAWAAAPPCSWRSATRQLVRRLVVDLRGLPLRRACPPRRSRCSRRSRRRCSPGSPMETEYQRLAPNPGDFPKLVEKLKTLDTTDFAWPERGRPRDRRADADRRSATPTASARARGRVVQAARRRRDGRPLRPAGVPARRAARHRRTSCRPAPASSTARTWLLAHDPAVPRPAASRCPDAGTVSDLRKYYEVHGDEPQLLGCTART